MDISKEFWDGLVATGREVSFSPGDILLREGDPPSHVLLLVAGRVKVLLHLPEGKVLLLAVREPGELLGVMGVVSGTPRSATVVALGVCRARALSSERFAALMSESKLEAELLRQSMIRIREGEAWRAETAALPAGARVIRALIRLASRRDDGAWELSLNQSEVGQAVGLSRSMVAAELARFRKRGLISTSPRRIVITNMARLKALADTGHGGV